MRQHIHTHITLSFTVLALTLFVGCGDDSPTAPGNSSGTGNSAGYRVNTGGPQIMADPIWDEDTSTNPSAFVNTGKLTEFDLEIDMSDPSIPPGTPPALFESERWDLGAEPEMHWAFPVTPGKYEVRLYFSEIYSVTQSVGLRVFDVAIEGNLVLDDYDVYADVGGYAGVVKTFVSNSDNNLDIDFTHVVQNPAIKAIEIIPFERK